MRDRVFGPDHLLWALSSNFWAPAPFPSTTRVRKFVAWCSARYFSCLVLEITAVKLRRLPHAAFCQVGGLSLSLASGVWLLDTRGCTVSALETESLRIPFRKLSWLYTYSPCSCVHWLVSCTRVLQVATQMSIDCIVGFHFLITELVAGPVRS